jgi:hypothetical protein
MSEAEQPELRPAADNAWYCLATLYGEQPVNGRDVGIAAKNRVAWNRWMAAALSDEQRTDFIKNGFPESELVPFTSAEKDEFFSAFASRIGHKKLSPPSATESVDFACTRFDRVVFFWLYLCERFRLPIVNILNGSQF